MPCSLVWPNLFQVKAEPPGLSCVAVTSQLRNTLYVEWIFIDTIESKESLMGNQTCIVIDQKNVVWNFHSYTAPANMV